MIHEQITHSVCKWIVSASLPFSTVENREFIRLLEVLDKSYKLPVRTTFQRRIIDEYKHRSVQIKELIAKEPGKISLTCDAWSSTVYKGYMEVTAHWIDTDRTLKSILLDFRRFPTPHTSEATDILLEEVVYCRGISTRLQAITTDNANDIVRGVSLLLQKLSHAQNCEYIAAELHQVYFAHY